MTKLTQRLFLVVGLGDDQKLPNQDCRPSCRPRLECADARGGREHDACFFEHARFPTVGSWAARRAD
jgi:hypothetical protein